MPSASPSSVTRLVDLLSRSGTSFAQRHPILLAGGVGATLGVQNAKGPAQRLEGEIMREYIGAPGAKYSSCRSLNKFAARKEYLTVKCMFEKTSSDEFSTGFESGIGRGVGSGIVTEGLAALRRLIGATAQSVKERFVDDPKREELVQTVLDKDPHVSTFEREQPGQAMQAYQTMARFAPTLSTDKNAVTAFLRNAAMTGGPMDHQMIKGIAEAETAIQRARNEGAWLRGGF